MRDEESSTVVISMTGMSKVRVMSKVLSKSIMSNSILSNSMLSKSGLLGSVMLVAVALLAPLAPSGPAQAQPAAPKLSGSYRCEPEPSSCQWSGQSFTVEQNGNKLNMKNDKGDIAEGLLSSNITLSVGAPWNMLGVIQPDNSIQWSNGTLWRKQ